MQAPSCACFMRLFPALNTLKAGQDVLFPQYIKYAKVLPLLTKLPQNLVSAAPENTLDMKKTLSENRKPIFKSIISTYVDFAENTSIHGLKYTVKKETCLSEKILWMLIVLLGITGSVFMVGFFWERYTSNPTRTSVYTTYAPTTAIPFPALTICNINKIFESKVDAFIKTLNLHGMEEKYIRSIFPQLLGYTSPAEYNTTDLKLLQTLLDLNDFADIPRVVKRISQSCREMLVKCQWESKIIECEEYFVDTVTPSGLCCSFNYNPINKNTLRLNSESKKANITFFFGLQMGLTVLLNPMVQDAQYSPLYSSGMKVIVHHPRNYPGFGNTEKILAVGRETLLQLEGTRYICSKEVRDLTPEQRKCVYSDEHSLRYFPEYREPNCMTECIADYIGEICECLPYFYSFADKPVCNVTKIPCLADTRHTKNSSHFRNMECYCPMQCEDVFYEVLSTSTKFFKTEYLTSSFLYDVNTTENSMLLHVYFSSQTQTILLRDTLTSPIYLLSSFGGIFSLFLGCSFISGAEIIYYVCVRFVINLQTLKKIKAKTLDNKNKNRLPKEVWQGTLKGDAVYRIYGRNVFLN